MASILKDEVQWESFVVGHIYERVELDKDLNELLEDHKLLVSQLNNTANLNLLSAHAGSFIYWMVAAINWKNNINWYLDDLKQNIDKHDNRARIKFIESNDVNDLKRLIDLAESIESKEIQIKKHTRKCPRFNVLYKKYLKTKKPTEEERLYEVRNYFYDLRDKERNKQYWIKYKEGMERKANEEKMLSWISSAPTIRC